jgi:hypothetical protein
MRLTYEEGYEYKNSNIISRYIMGGIMWKNKCALLLLSLIAGCLMLSFSPYVPSYGGSIQITNKSSHNLYIIGESDNEPNERLCAEKNERVIIFHRVYGDTEKPYAYPAKYYKRFSFYDFDTGSLLKRLNASQLLFIQISGSIDSNDALFSLVITDNILK